MYAVERLGSYISTVSGPFHPFGGAVDIIVVQQQDGSFKSSPWYVKFGKFQGVLKAKERLVNIRVNDVEAHLHMYLNHKGEAYFLKELDEGEGNSFIFSSFSSGDDETDEQSTNRNMKKMKSCNFDAEKDVSAQIDVGSGQTVARMNSRRSRILGLVFGRKSMKNDGEGIEGREAGVARASSLERAEIAADLLEVKWSTNLPTGRTRRNNSTRLSASDTETQEIDRDFSVNDEHGQGRVLVHDSAHDACDNSQLQEASGSGDHEIAIVPNLPSLRPVDNFSEISTLDASIVQEKQKICQRQTSMGINSIDVGNVKCAEMEGAPIHEITFHHQPDMDCDVKCTIDEMSELLRFDLPEKESETFVVQRHKIEESIASFDVPGNKGAEMLNFSDEECKEAEVDAKFLLKEAELTSELNSQSKRASFMAKDNVDGGSLFDCDSREFLKVEIVHGSDLMSTDADKGNTLMETLSSFKINLTNSDSEEAEVLGDNNEENIEGVVEKGMELETLDDLRNQSQKLGFVHSCASSVSGLALGETSNATGLVIQETRLQAFRSIKEIESHDDVVSSILEEPSNAPGPVIEMMMNNQAFGSLEEPESQDDSVSSSLSNFIHPVQGMIALDEECGRNNFHPSDIIGENQGLNTDNLAGSAANSSRSCLETLEEIQFLFSDMNHFQRRKDSSSPNSMETQQNLFVSQDEKQKPNNTNEFSTSSLKLGQEHFPICYEPQLDESKKNSVSSLGIPIGGNGSAKGMPLRIGSLPNLQSGINSFKTSDTKQPLSRSLDFECESLKLSVLNNSFSNSLNSNLYLEKQSAEECPTLEEIQFFEEFKNLLTTTKVEISLCKHLLKERMGTDAASQAFDAERVDLEKFLSLGPAFLKNDRLIVRIGSRYFPWDAAEPIIVGMISCSQQQSMDPEGTVAANRLVETLVVDSSKAIEPSAGSTSGGSWRLWPFRASRSSGSVKPVSDEAKVSAAENVPDSTCDLEVDKAEPKVNISKKKLKSIVPTSKQLASLNLKEGQNIVTFSFSTTMLGKQQVDARIYLWKWNTRIVISDVDGTITRSDVLGQFMPLVGRDWSQIGVAHLFSAIKENGYQLLFLSARAISQAHLTRQFLFNLKQDGKALPDGPVVISPDGLFPSLFREVIRRAPHEFKIACLKDIKELFPPDCNPFYAGFGNRDTDEISYLKVGIPKGKIFIINAKGEVTVNRRVDRKSYNSLHMLVHDMFPAMSSSEQEEFNSWNYWRTPLPQIST